MPFAIPWQSILPELVLSGAGLFILVLDLYLGRRQKPLLGYLSLGLVGAALLSVLAARGGAGGEVILGRMLVSDPYAIFFKVLFLAALAVLIMMSFDFVGRRGLPAGEYYTLLMFAGLGMILMASSMDLIMIYLGLELTSISSYVLAGLLRNDPKSNEAAIKYFLNGALASAIVLFGMSLAYGLSGTTYLPDLAMAVFAGQGAVGKLWLAAMALLIGGLGFKIAAVPFHMWAPDAYEGAPTPVTAFFSVGPKGAAFAALLRIFALGLVGLAGQWTVAFAVLSVVTMTVGNLAAIMQTDIKRMLAYSSIAHAGYILVGLAAGSHAGVTGILFYILAYAFTNLGAFAVVLMLENNGLGTGVKDFTGLGQRSPLAAAALTLFFVSLIGIPFTSGFFGKFFLFAAAINSGLTWLAVAMAINSAISVAYYYGVVRNMYLVQSDDTTPLVACKGLQVSMVACMVITLGLGLAANTFLQWTHVATLAAGLIR